MLCKTVMKAKGIKTSTLATELQKNMGGKTSKTFSPIKDKYKTFQELITALKDAGMDSSQMILAFDLSKSNQWSGMKTYGHSLHDLAMETPYERVCRLVAPFLSIFDDDGIIPAIRFGDSDTKDYRVLPLDPTTDYPHCRGFEEVFLAYRKAVTTLRASGPTTMAPIIRYAIDVTKTSREYHILLILTDGDISSFTRDSEAIIDASRYPLSIVAIGIGDGPFKELEVFDSLLPQRNFDNFQFVDFTKLEKEFAEMDRPDLVLATAIFQEIPDQYRLIKRLGYL